MNLKKIKIIMVIIIFTLCFPLHFIYEWLPSMLSAIFVPVNESIWEHMKILFCAFLIGGLIEYVFIKYFNVENKSILFSTFVGGIVSIPLYLLMFLPLYYMGHESMILNIGCMMIVIIVIVIMQYYIAKLNIPNILNILAIPFIIGTFIIFGYLTYYPILNHLFYDTKDEKYGLSIYRSNQTKRADKYSAHLYKTLKR